MHMCTHIEMHTCACADLAMQNLYYQRGGLCDPQPLMYLQVDALWQPDLHLLPGNVCNAIQGVNDIGSERVGVKCSVCERSDGATIRCSQGHCSVPFHPLCARNAGQYLSVHPTGNKTVYRAFCANHSQQARNKDRELGISIEVLSSHLCDFAKTSTIFLIL